MATRTIVNRTSKAVRAAFHQNVRHASTLKVGKCRKLETPYVHCAYMRSCPFWDLTMYPNASNCKFKIYSLALTYA